MKKLIVPIMMFIASSCISNKIVTTFYEVVTNTPVEVIDSINNTHKLNFTNNYEDWNKAFYISNDSIIVTSYLSIVNRNDTNYIISITKNQNDSIYYFKLRKE